MPTWKHYEPAAPPIHRYPNLYGGLWSALQSLRRHAVQEEWQEFAKERDMYPETLGLLIEELDKLKKKVERND